MIYTTVRNNNIIITFRLSRRRREMHCVHPRLRACLSVCGRMPTLLHGPGCNLGEWWGMPPSCTLLGGFAIAAWVALLWQQRELEMLASTCLYSLYAYFLFLAPGDFCYLR